jgi:hypothetical protein
MTNTKMGRKPLPVNERRKSITACCSPATIEFFNYWMDESRSPDNSIRKGDLIDLLVTHATATGFTI